MIFVVIVIFRSLNQRHTSLLGSSNVEGHDLRATRTRCSAFDET